MAYVWVYYNSLEPTLHAWTPPLIMA